MIALYHPENLQNKPRSATISQLLHPQGPPRVRRLELGYRTNNPASAAVARHAGFVVEGVEREKFCYDGVLYDAAIAARLHRDVDHVLAATSSSGVSAAL